jgi:glycosyltransferase involved in cell wall biosynthesis
MKTILIAHNYSKVSFSYMSYGVANYLSNNGFRVVFISHNPYFIKTQRNINKNGELIITSWSSSKRPTGLKDLFRFIRVFRKYRPNYVIGHFGAANISILVSKILSLGKTKCFIYYHTLSSQLFNDLDSNNFKYFLEKKRKMIFFKLFVNVCICPSELSRKDIIKTFLVNHKKTKVILNAIEDRKSKERNLLKRKKFYKISYLGRLDPSKNVKLLLTSFIEFKEKNPTSILSLSVAGSGQDSKEIKRVCNKYEYLNFEGALSYNKVDSFLSNTDYTIIPSISDNLPTVGIESLMNGTPILISVDTGLSKYCSNNKNSIIFKPTKKGLIKLFEKVLNDDFLDMKLEARKLFEKKFSIATYCKEFENLIKE